MFKKFFAYLTLPYRILERLNNHSLRIEEIQLALGRLEARESRTSPDTSLQDHEFKVFSQWGEDGILDYLASRIPAIPRSFIEFGVEDYKESNTRFLLQTRGWKGLVIDGDEKNVSSIKRSHYHVCYPLRAACAFVTRDNVNTLFESNGFSGALGLLSIDVDGMDYWLWEAIQCVTPAVVVIEYNALFGPTAAVVTPYQADFNRFKAHYSGLYGGASLAALDQLAKAKGYSLVGVNKAGNNAFFVQNDRLGPLRAVEPAEVHAPPLFKDSRDETFTQSHLGPRDSLKLISHMKVLNLRTAREETIGHAVPEGAWMDVFG